MSPISRAHDPRCIRDPELLVLVGRVRSCGKWTGTLTRRVVMVRPRVFARMGAWRTGKDCAEGRLDRYSGQLINIVRTLISLATFPWGLFGARLR